MSTTIQVPASAIAFGLKKSIGHARKNREQAYAEYDKVERNLASGNVLTYGYVHIDGMEQRAKADSWLNALLALQLAVDNGWPINLGSEYFYLLEIK